MISIVTITARKDPMPQPMFQSLEHSIMQAGANVLAEWIVVDAGLWWDPNRVRMWHNCSSGYLPTYPVAPKHSHFHGPWVNQKQLPDQNGARNTGIVYAQGDYLVFLDDCTVVHPTFWQRVVKAAQASLVVKFAHQYLPAGHWNKIWPDSIPASEEPLCKQDPTSLRGSAVGFPLKALIEVNGFDEMYSGGPKEDIELGIRLARRGWPIWLDRNTVICESMGQEDLFRDAAPYENEARLDRLLSDPNRFLPYGNQFDLAEVRWRVQRWHGPA